jgi:ribosomal protein RSM22 (predicted rRNA methylase)
VNPRTLVAPLEARWQGIVDEVLRPHRLATADVAKLAPKVAELSRAYNAAKAEGRRTRLPLEARIAFSFPRDVPKGAGAVRELVASGALAIPRDRPLRVLDLGAGLGAMTWGLVRALSAAGGSGRVEAMLVDEDAEALGAARSIADAARAALGAAPVALAVRARTAGAGSAGDLRALSVLGRHDVVILGQVLSELDPRAEPAVRLERHAALVEEALATLLAPGGALVVVEPALRDRTRHLHAVRDRLIERGAATVFAPCPHEGACPMLPIDTEWCHEDLPVDLPAWTAPLARAAGLRWQGLTFSYLVLRRDGARPTTGASPGVVRFRVVSDLLRSKGKAELFVCCEDGARRRIRQLDRDAGAEAFGELGRGDVVTMTSSDARPPIDERGRVQPCMHVAIDVAPARK